MPTFPTRTVRLTERVPRVCRLAPADVEYLLAHHRAHVELMSTGRRHVYRLTPTGHVGVIVAPRCRLLIRPKIPLQNLFYLLDPALPVPSVRDRVQPPGETDILDILAGQFAHLLAERVAAGLHRDYVERTEQGPFLHGRLDVPAQMRESAVRKEQLHSRHDDFTADLPCNKILKETAEHLLISTLLAPEVSAGLRRAQPAFTGVSSTHIGSDSFSRLVPERLPEGYRPLLDLCRLLAEGWMPDGSPGTTPAPAFLVNMERAFEGHLTRGVVAAFAGKSRWTVAAQQRVIVNRPAERQPDLSLRPDLIVQRDGRSVLVVDAKWKRLPKDALITEDVYQVLAYASALGARVAVLVYPGGRERVWEYTLTDSPIRLVVRTLGVTGTRAACARALRRLGEWVERILTDVQTGSG